MRPDPHFPLLDLVGGTLPVPSVALHNKKGPLCWAQNYKKGPLMILLVKINPECSMDDDAIIAELESLEALVFQRCKASGYIRYKKERDFF
jgi:hypothetical protein